ncbi:zinc-finger protein, partial [Spiromyces aspiralis]
IGGPRLAASDVPTTLGSAATTIITTIALNNSNGGGGGGSSSNSNSNSNIRHFEKNRGSGSMGDTKQAYMGGWDAQFPWLNWSSRFGKYSNKAKDNQWLSTKMPQSLGNSTSLLSQQRLATSSLPTEPKSSPQSRDLANNATPAFSAPAIAKNNEQCGEKRAQRWNKKPSSDHKHRGEAVSVCSLDRDRWDQGVTNVDGGNGAAAAAAAATEANSFVVEKLGNSQQYDSDGNPRPQQCLWSTCAQIFSSIDDLVRHLYKLHVATNRSSQNATNPNGRLGELTTGSKGLGSSSSSGSEQGAVFLDASESNTRDNLSDDEDLSSEDGDDYAGGGSSTADFLCKWASCRALKHDTDELIQHVCRDHLGAARIIYRCHWSQCHEEYESIDDLTSHLSNDHVGSGKHEYVCWWEGCERNGKP